MSGFDALNCEFRGSFLFGRSLLRDSGRMSEFREIVGLPPLWIRKGQFVFCRLGLEIRRGPCLSRRSSES